MKKYLRWLSVIFLIFLLVGCGSKSGSAKLPTLSATLKKEIEAAFKAEWNNPNLIWYDESDSSTWAEGVRYYGTYGNAVALYRGGSGEYPMGEMGIDNGIIFYSNGEIHSIYSAEKASVLTRKDIQNVANFHKEFSLTTEKKGSVFVQEGSEGVIVLPAELQKEVESAWWETKNCELNWTKKRNDLRYYGNYDGSVVIYTDFSALGDWYEIKIGGVKIGGGNFSLYAYRDGELLPLTEDVYANGWLTEENLKTIAKYHALCESRERQ